MAKYRDRHHIKSKPLTFYYEDYRTRHANRLKFNLKHQSEVNQFCNANLIRLKIKNEGHHWIFVTDEKLIEWWPSSAKLVIDKDWENGIHVHDYQQAIQILEVIIKNNENEIL